MNAAMQTPVPAEEFRRIPLVQLVESPNNPRRHFDEAYLAELAESVRQQGIVQPIVVRRSQANGRADKFEIVAGACRFRAARQAKLDAIPALVRSLSDDQALEVQIIENVQRKDIAPLDEAYGFKQLVDHDRSVKDIAEKIGKSEEYVRARLKLLDAGAPVQKALAEGRIKTEQATILARLPAKAQAEGLSKCTDSWRPATVQQLRQWAKEKDDDAKRQERMQGEISRAKAAGERVVLISEFSYNRPAQNVLLASEYTAAGKSKCDHLARGIYVRHGGGYSGQNAKVCTKPRSCATHKPKVDRGMREARHSARTGYSLAADRKRQARVKAAGLAIARILQRTPDKLGGRELDIILDSFLDRLWHDHVKAVCKRHGWEPAKPKRGNRDYNGEIRKQVAKMPQGLGSRPRVERDRFLFELALQQHTGVYDSGSLGKVARAYRVPLAMIERHVLAELTAKAKKPKPAKRKK